MTLNHVDGEGQAAPTPLPKIDTSYTNTDELVAEEIKLYIKEFGADSAEFRNYVNNMDIVRLRYYNYDTFYLNLLSVFGNQLSYREIKRLAAKCTKFRLWNSWEYQCRIKAMASREVTGRSAHLRGWDTNKIDSLLARGNGLIICTHHYGAYRDIASDLVLLGYKVLAATDRGMARFYNRSVEECRGVLLRDRKGNLQSFADQLLYLDVERAMATVEIVSALRRGEIVIFIVDGNSGADTRWGSDNKCAFLFLGCNISVRTGAASIAMILQTPLLLLLTSYENEEETPRIVSCEELDVWQPRDSDERQQIGRECTRRMYSLLEESIINHPVQWETACFFHRWHTKEPALGSAGVRGSMTPNQIATMLEQKTRLRLDRQRVASIWTPNPGNLLIDVSTLITYKLPEGSSALIEALMRDDGVDIEWLGANAPEPAMYDKFIRTLAKLSHLYEPGFTRNTEVTQSIKKGGR